MFRGGMFMYMGKSVRILYSKYVSTTKQTKSRQVVYSVIGMISFKIIRSWRKDIQRIDEETKTKIMIKL